MSKSTSAIQLSYFEIKIITATIHTFGGLPVVYHSECIPLYKKLLMEHQRFDSNVDMLLLPGRKKNKLN